MKCPRKRMHRQPNSFMSSSRCCTFPIECCYRDHLWEFLQPSVRHSKKPFLGQERGWGYVLVLLWCYRRNNRGDLHFIWSALVLFPMSWVIFFKLNAPEIRRRFQKFWLTTTELIESWLSTSNQRCALERSKRRIIPVFTWRNRTQPICARERGGTHS
jgi:hypothetical protein